MSVYKEGYSIIGMLQDQSKLIFSDAADWGAPTNKGDKLWNAVQQLVDWYGNYWDDTKGAAVKFAVKRNSKGCSTFVELMDEWDTGKTERFEISYTKLDSFQNKPYLQPWAKTKDGFFTVNQVK